MSSEVVTHPRIRERRAEVADQTIRKRRRKIIAFAVLVVVGLLAFAATQSPLLDVDEVRIVGAERLAPDELRRVAAVEIGTPVLGLDTGAIEARVGALPQVESVVASKGWGGVVTIEIAERLAVARIESADGTIIVAADGVVLDVVERAVVDEVVTADGSTLILEPLPADLERLPEIAGAIFTIESGETVPSALDDAVVVASVLPDDIRAVVERIEITVDSLLLRAVGGGRFALGDARDLDVKFGAIRAFLDQADLTCLETLNVQAPAVPVIRRSC